MPSQGEAPAVELGLTIDAGVSLPPTVTEATLRALTAFALADEGASGWWEINFRFASDAGIRRLHLDFMGLDSPTDIMTFPYEPDQLAGFIQPNAGGDIVISVETAGAQAADAAWPLEDELMFLSLHGLLHLLGWNDDDPGKRSAMLDRQEEILDRWRRHAGSDAG